MDALIRRLNFKDGLIPAIIASVEGQPLTLCYMDEVALQRTLATGQVHVFRRSRGRVMLKGESSGHTQQVKEVRVDCAENSLLFFVEQKVAACHAGYFTCYYRRYDAADGDLKVCEKRFFDPEEVYTQENG